MLIGHKTQLNFLQKSYETGQNAHAYLFVGPRGVGKETVARELINKIIKKTNTAAWSWQIKYVERSIDLKTGRKHKDISIEQVHDIGDYLSHHTLVADFQIVLINEADFLSRGAGNALLKMLEEPRAQKSLTILLAESEENVLPTIKSRCQLIRFHPVPTKDIFQELINRGTKKETAMEIARLANYRPGVAVELLNDPEKLSFYKREFDRFFKLHKGGLSERWNLLSDLFGAKAERGDHIEARDRLIKILELWQILWRDFYLSQNQMDEFVSDVEEIEKIRSLAKRYDTDLVRKVLKNIEEAVKMLRQNVHPRLIIENLILSFY